MPQQRVFPHMHLAHLHYQQMELPDDLVFEHRRVHREAFLSCSHDRTDGCATRKKEVDD